MSSLHRSTRAREDRLRGEDRVGLPGPGAAELWLQRCSRSTPSLSVSGKRDIEYLGDALQDPSGGLVRNNHRGHERFFVAAGGLISYGADQIDQYRRAAGYVDRILRGEKPADLPVQAPTKYRACHELKTAKALGLTCRRRLLARADEVIE